MGSKYKNKINDIILAWVARRHILLCQDSIDDLTTKLDGLVFSKHVSKDSKQNKKPCPWCNGKGYRFKGINYRQNCVVCKGSGQVDVSYPL